MRRFFSLLSRSILFVIFIGYFLVALAVNSSRIEQWLHPLDRLHLTHIECLDKQTICLGTYPSEKTLRRLRPATVVSLLNPKIPFSRELVEAERQLCRKLGIDFVSIPFSLFSEDPSANSNLLSLLKPKEVKRPIYIHGYLFDHRLETLKHRIIMKYKAIE